MAPSHSRSAPRAPLVLSIDLPPLGQRRKPTCRAPSGEAASVRSVARPDLPARVRNGNDFQSLDAPEVVRVDGEQR